jgi:hypothetical protein
MKTVILRESIESNVGFEDIKALWENNATEIKINFMEEFSNIV